MTFAGVWGFALTPFRGDVPDVVGIQAIADRIAGGNADVICVNGLVAQGDTMSPAERASSVEAVMAAVSDRAPVVATIFGMDDIEYVSTAVLDGVVVVPPSEHLSDTLAILDACIERRPEINALVYHRPPLTLTPDDLARLTDRSNLVAIKEGHADVRRFRQLGDQSDGRVTWVAAHEDLVLPYWALGAAGHCPVSAIYAPEYTHLWADALDRGDVATVHRLLSAHAYGVANLRFARPLVDIAVVKAIAGRFGLDAGDSRAPAKPLNEGELRAVVGLAEGLEQLLDEEQVTRLT